MKPPECPECHEPFTRSRIGQKTCAKPKCAISWSQKNPEKGLRANKVIEGLAKRIRSRQRREKLESLMTRSDWLKRAQKAFNAYIRERDKNDPCISCQTSSGCKVNAGHFRSTAAAPELRFHEDNVHLQCERCNTYLSANIECYRPQLIKKIGRERVEWLEGPHEPLKLTIDQIKAIEQTYKAKLKALQNSD